MRMACSCKGGKSIRRAYLDNVRWVTVILVVIYHVFYMYNGEGISGGIGKITDLPVQYYDVYMYMVYPWFMSVLFIVAGAASRYWYDKHGRYDADNCESVSDGGEYEICHDRRKSFLSKSDHEFIKSRTARLLVPCTIGLLAFGFLQGFVNVAIGGGFSWMDGVPIIIKILIVLVSGTGVLWFIQMLWLFSMLLVPVRMIDRDRLWNAGARVSVPALVIMALPVWAASQVLNTPIICVYRFGLYSLMFFLGYFVFSHDEVIERLKQWFPMFLAAGVLIGGAFCWKYFGENYADAPVNRTPLFTGFCWFACLAVIGGMAKCGDVSNRYTRWMSRKSFGLYVFHYLGISSFALFVGKAGLLPAWTVYVLSFIAGFAGGYALNAIVSHVPFLRWAVLGIKTQPAETAEADPAEANKPRPAGTAAGQTK